MRLTLRTMLAYLDDILEPDDAAEIGRKIDESEFATDLVRKTRDVMRRLRLGAPQVVGRGMGVDPNSVAEYLDNTMPPEQVADFERVCLESDVHLAEVSACHQVLTLVLGEPAEVLPASRERMYGIAVEAERLAGERVEPAHSEPVAPPKMSHAAAAPSTALAEEAKRVRPKPEVPEYLREARRSRWKTAVGIIAVGALIGAGLMVLLTELGLVGGGIKVAQPPVEAPAVAPPTVEMGTEVELAEAAVEPQPAAPPLGDANGAPPLGSALPLPPAPAETEMAPAAETAPAVAESGLSLPQEVPAEDEPALPPEPAASPATDAIEPETELAAAGIPAEGETPRVASRPLEPLAQPESLAPADEAEPAEPADLIGGNRVGIYVFDNNVLLRSDPQAGEWQRLHLPSPLAVGDRLLSLPTYRNTINLSTGLTLQLVGGTSLVLGEIDSAGVQEVELLYGRIVLMSVGRDGTRLRLKLGEQRAVVGFGGAGSTLAIEMHRLQVPGQNPESGPAPVEVDLYVPSGNIVWHQDGEAQTVSAPAQWRLSGQPGASEGQVPPMPEWITSEPLSVIDRNASHTLEEALAPGRPVTLSLAELVNGRRLEVRSLAARSSVYIGQFEPFVAALNDPDQHARWAGHIETLREALALGPGVAEKAREAFLRRRGDDGQALYRMLWGYSNEDLRSGAAQQLVNYLDHDSLDYRVLAFWNLEQITGYGLNYRPDYSAARRQQSVRRWQERLAAGAVERPAETAP